MSKMPQTVQSRLKQTKNEPLRPENKGTLAILISSFFARIASNRFAWDVARVIHRFWRTKAPVLGLCVGSLGFELGLEW